MHSVGRMRSSPTCLYSKTKNSHWVVLGGRRNEIMDIITSLALGNRLLVFNPIFNEHLLCTRHGSGPGDTCRMGCGGEAWPVSAQEESPELKDGERGGGGERS